MANNLVDGHKLMYHPERVSEWLEKGDCFPIYVEIGPTGKCNHRCVFCAVDWLKYGGASIGKEIMFRTLEDLAQSGVKSVMFAGEGEPLLHRDISEFVNRASNNNLSVAITTNGVLFDKEMAESCLPKLSWIRFSVDAGTPEIYALVHGTKTKDFDRVIQNIIDAVDVKKRFGLSVDIDVQALLIPESANGIEKLASLIKNVGADSFQIKPYSQHPLSINRFVVDYRQYSALEPILKQFESEKFKVWFRRATMERLQEGADYNCCHGLPFFSLIDSKGNVIPCNLFYNNPDFTYGNLYEKKFSEIWKGEKRQEVIKKLNKKGIKECRESCRLDVINRYLHKLENLTSNDNFI